MSRYIDLSMCIENEIVSDPDFARPKVEYMDHFDTLPRMQKSFPNLAAEQLPDGAAWAVERVTLTTHNGTHLDAPYHFHPTMNHAIIEGGEPAWTIDEVPLDWCLRPGVKLDFRHFADGYVATAQDVADELERIGHDLQPYDI